MPAKTISPRPMKPLKFNVSFQIIQLIIKDQIIKIYSKGATLGGEPILKAWKIHKNATTPVTPIKNNEKIMWILLKDHSLSKKCKFGFEESS